MIKKVNMLIRYAEITDYLWLKEHENIIGWLRYNLFLDNVPFMNTLFILEAYRNKGIGIIKNGFLHRRISRMD
jgi:hypothetical protein